MSQDPQAGTTIACQEAVELVTDYLEGALDHATRVELEAHLALCEGCDIYLVQMRDTISRLGAVPVDTLSGRAQADLIAVFRALYGNRSTS